MPAPPFSPKPEAPHRLVALDWMRGLVMVLMAFDHSSEELNAGRLFTDGALFYQPGTPLPAAQFLARWVTHLCAPTFVWLAGASLALQSHRRKAAGESAASIDRHLALRGLVIVGFELWVSFFWMPRGKVLFQVLYAIGTSMVLMVPLRRLPVRLLAVLAVCLLVLGEAFDRWLGWGSGRAPVLATLLLVPGRHGPLLVAYPALPWLAIMALGWAFGTFLVRRPEPATTARYLAAGGLAMLALFAVVRGTNGYGNMGLLREDGSLVQWLHVSKYPPSLTFAALELGLGALLLSGFTLAAGRVAARPRGLLMVLGRTPMFFYLLHVPCLFLAARASGYTHALGLGGTALFAGAVIVVLYPLCRWYGRYKAAHPDALTRYV